MSELDAQLLACNEGTPYTLRVLVDRDGEPQRMESDPVLEADPRVCVGRLVYDAVNLERLEGDEEQPRRIIAHSVGGGEAAPVEASAEQPIADEPVDEPVSDEPVSDEPVSDEPGEPADEAASDEDGESTDLPDDLVE